MRFRMGEFGCLILLLAAAVGCAPQAQSELDEQKEPHYIEGKSKAAALDSKGAIESFENALQANPHSASAHFELGVLYEQNETDFAAAIYHYERFLKMRPKSDYAERVRQRVNACTQELAKTVAVGPVPLPMQRDFDRLAREVNNLKEELSQCRKAAAGNVQEQPASPMPAQNPARASAASSPGPTTQSSVPVANLRAARTAAPMNAMIRTHTVNAGETPTLIAKKYGLRVEALMAANPGVDPRRLQIGKTLNLPGS